MYSFCRYYLIISQLFFVKLKNNFSPCLENLLFWLHFWSQGAICV